MEIFVGFWRWGRVLEWLDRHFSGKRIFQGGFHIRELQLDTFNPSIHVASRRFCASRVRSGLGLYTLTHTSRIVNMLR